LQLQRPLSISCEHLTKSPVACCARALAVAGRCLRPYTLGLALRNSHSTNCSLSGRGKRVGSRFVLTEDLARVIPARHATAPARNTGGYAYQALDRSVGVHPLHRNRRLRRLREGRCGKPRSGNRCVSLGIAECPIHWHWSSGPARWRFMEFLRWLNRDPHATLPRAITTVRATARLYQGRFKSFPIEEDEHLLRVIRYGRIATPWRAGLVGAAEDWRLVDLMANAGRAGRTRSWRRGPCRCRRSGSSTSIRPERRPVRGVAASGGRGSP